MLSSLSFSDAPPETMLSELDSSVFRFSVLSELGLSELDELELEDPDACSNVS